MNRDNKGGQKLQTRGQMTKQQATQIVERAAKIVCSVHGVLSATDAEQIQEARELLGHDEANRIINRLFGVAVQS